MKLSTSGFRPRIVPCSFEVHLPFLDANTPTGQALAALVLQSVDLEVVIEYGEDLPYDQDVAVRFSNIPIHQLCDLVRGAFSICYSFWPKST